MPSLPTPRREVDSPYAWFRLAIAMLLCTIGGVGIWSFVVALPAVQLAFHLDRGTASLPYTLCTIGFALGGVPMGWIADRKGVALPVIGGAIALGLGYTAAGLAPSATLVALAYGLPIGFLGCSATFVPLVAEISHWFVRRRGIAVSIVAGGNYLAGTLWPPILERAIAQYGWRATHIGIGAFCVLTMLPLALLLRGRPPGHATGRPAAPPSLGTLGLRPATPADAARRRRPVLLRRHGDAAGAHRRLLRRPRLRRARRRHNAVAHARLRPAQPHRLRLHRRPHRRPRHPADRLARANVRAGAVPRPHQPQRPVRRLRPVRPVPGRPRAELRHHHPRVLPGTRSRPPRSASCS